MAFRGLTVIDVKEVLRRWSAGQSDRKIAREACVDRKTAARYTAVAASLFERAGGNIERAGGNITSVRSFRATPGENRQPELASADGRGRMTAPRRILPGQFYLVTRRTWQRTFFLRPDPAVNTMFEYCLAEAAKKHDIDLISWCAMSNHYHAVIYDRDGRVPAFIERFHKMVGKVLSAHYGRFEGIWSRDQTCLTRLVTMSDVLDSVAYVLSNPAAAHLVEDIAQYPGSSSWDRIGRAAKTVERPKVYFRDDGRMPSRVELQAVAPRGLGPEKYKEWIERVRAAVRKRQSELAKERKRPVLGAKGVMKMNPFASPKTQAPRRKLRPHLACQDKKLMKEERRLLKEFRAEYRTVRIRLRTGEGKVEFPEGTYRLRLLGLRCKGCIDVTRATSAGRSKRPPKKARNMKKAAA